MIQASNGVPVCVAGLEVYIFGVDTAPDAPVVFVTHGRGGKVADTFWMCRDLADLGLCAIGIEQRNHGRRLVDADANGDWSATQAADMYSNIVGTALDVSLLIDMIPARLGIAMTRVGMTGISMGGHATFVAMALDSRILVGAPLIGSGDFRRLMWLRARNHGCAAEDFSRYFPAGMEAASAKFDAINHVDRFADRPLLMANGEADTLVQIECNRGFADACRPYYTKAERLLLSAYPGIGHEVSPDMWREAVTWLHDWLLTDDL